MERQDRAMGLLWVLLGIIISAWSATFPFGGIEEPGPGYLPLACGVIIAVLGAILFARPANPNDPGDQPILPRGPGGRRVALTLAAMGFCTALLYVLGFILSVFFMVLFLMRSVGPVKWKMALFYAILYSSASYFVFKVLLKTQFPAGILWT